MIDCAEVKYCKWHIPGIMFVIGVINATGWYVYIWIFMMEPSVNVMILHYNTTLTPSSKAIYSGTKYYDTHIEFHSLFLDVSSTDV